MHIFRNLYEYTQTLTYFPKDILFIPETLDELKELVNIHSLNLGQIDTKHITNMRGLFMGNTRTDYIGIETWDTSHVTDMSFMFAHTTFNVDINCWNVSNVINMSHMFFESSFNNDLDKWDVSKVTNMSWLFAQSNFNSNISTWNTKKCQ